MNAIELADKCGKMTYGDCVEDPVASFNAISALQGELRRLHAENELLRKHSARLNWLLDRLKVNNRNGYASVALPCGNSPITHPDKVESIKAIDAAMEKQI